MIGVQEVAAVLGIGLVGFGLYQAWPPLCPIWIGGAILFVVALTLPRPRRD
jgi:hypothetical protein